MSNPIETLQYELILEEIASTATFSLGRKTLLEILPSSSRLWIKRENKRVQTAMNCERIMGTIPMPGMSDITIALTKASKDQTCDFEELISVARFTHSVLQTQAYFKQTEVDISDLEDLVSALEVKLDVAKNIERCFSPANEMLDNASKELFSIRHKLRKKSSERVEKIQRFIAANSSKLSENISTLRNDRIVVLVKNSDKNSFGGIIHGESASGLSAYVEPALFIQLNNEISDLIFQETQEVEHICFTLSQSIKPYVVMYQSSLSTMAILDSVFARAVYGNKHYGVCAQLNDQKEFFLKNARHPLIDPKDVVSNTYTLDSKHSMILITGPNTGGKTVSLKVMGLACLCAYSGIPILADEARLPLFDQIFVDIGDDQSIQQSLSTFSSHLLKLIDVTQKATEHSFVLLDELGGGTDPVEGESLAIAILEHLRSKKLCCVATTHYTGLKNYAMQHEDVLIASVQFDMEKMQPNYKYVESLPGQSFAFEIAERFGLDESILNKAKENREAAKTNAEKQLEKVEHMMADLYQKEERLNAFEAKLEADQDVIAKAKERFITYKDELYDKAQVELKNFIEEKEDEVLNIIDDLKKDHKQSMQSAQVSLKKLQEISPQEESQVLKSVKVGQWVKLRLSSQVGQVVEARKKKIFVSINGIRMEVKLEDLSEGTPPVNHKKFVMKSEPISTVAHELKVIGLRVDEALPLVDRYLDDCVRAHYPFCRIIHGFGTGALRTAIQNHLTKASFVESYRFGENGEGGQGATIVNFKGHKS